MNAKNQRHVYRRGIMTLRNTKIQKTYNKNTWINTDTLLSIFFRKFWVNVLEWNVSSSPMSLYPWYKMYKWSAFYSFWKMLQSR